MLTYLLLNQAQLWISPLLHKTDCWWKLWAST